MKKLAPTLVNQIYEATLKTFWRKNALRRFLRQAGVAESFVNSWASDESKRTFLDRLFLKVTDLPMGSDLLLRMADELVKPSSFPDLQGWEDSEVKITEATAAVAELRKAMASVNVQVQSEAERVAAQKRATELRAETQRSQQTLASLDARLKTLAGQLGTSEAGYAFQDWFYDLVDFFEVPNRRPYKVGGRQIDGSLTVSGTTYLVELKFTTEQAGSTDIDSLLKKVNDKADNTMGILVSISGYSGVAVTEASGRKTPLLLMDHRHIYFLLAGSSTLAELVDRVRRHASQTGEALLPPEQFGG
jgi:hypothetical protein